MSLTKAFVIVEIVIVNSLDGIRNVNGINMDVKAKIFVKQIVIREEASDFEVVIILNIVGEAVSKEVKSYVLSRKII